MAVNHNSPLSVLVLTEILSLRVLRSVTLNNATKQYIIAGATHLLVTTKRSKTPLKKLNILNPTRKLTAVKPSTTVLITDNNDKDGTKIPTTEYKIYCPCKLIRGSYLKQYNN
jgi:hypothetical protein